MKPLKQHLKERIPSIPREYEEEILQEICEAVKQWLQQYYPADTTINAEKTALLNRLLEELEK